MWLHIKGLIAHNFVHIAPVQLILPQETLQDTLRPGFEYLLVEFTPNIFLIVALIRLLALEVLLIQRLSPCQHELLHHPDRVEISLLGICLSELVLRGDLRSCAYLSIMLGDLLIVHEIEINQLNLDFGIKTVILIQECSNILLFVLKMRIIMYDEVLWLHIPVDKP